jgi:hypothetical protein
MILEPYQVVVLVPRSRGDTRAFLRRGQTRSHEARGDSKALSCRVMGLVPQGTWQHWSPFLVSGAHGALEQTHTISFPGAAADGALALHHRGGGEVRWGRERQKMGTAGGSLSG